jgi:hypothetical protein
MTKLPAKKEGSMSMSKSLRRALFWMGLAVGAAVPASIGCSHLPGRSHESWPMKNATQVPAASGSVRVVDTDGANTTLELDVQHLARAKEAFTGKQTYVVWIQSDAGGTAENEGELRLDDDLKGKLRTRTPFRQFHLFVTAEPQANVTEPSDERVLDTAVTLPTDSAG